jgi:hypothetical protein
LQLKRPEMMSQQWFFDWDNARGHTDAVVSSWFDAHGVQRLEHAPFSPILAPTDFVLLKKTKWGLAGQSLDQDSFKNAWEGVARPLIAVAFAAAFRSMVARCKKRARLGSKFVKKP